MMCENFCGKAEWDIEYMYMHDDLKIREWRMTHQKLCAFMTGDLIQDLKPSHLLRLERLS